MAEKGAGLKWGDVAQTDWIDISIPYRNKIVYWPSDPVPRIERIKDRDKGDDGDSDRNPDNRSCRYPCRRPAALHRGGPDD